MAILNYTTSINSERTISEIQKHLVKHGAKKIVTDYKNGVASGVTFALIYQGQLMFFALPCNYEGVYSIMVADKSITPKLKTKDQAIRVSWRIIKDWVEAQMAIVEAKLADPVEVFLPYAIHKSGDTLYNHLKGNGMLMLNS